MERRTGCNVGEWIVARKRSTKPVAEPGDIASLRHVLVVGGTTSGWTALGADLWAIRRQELAKAVAHAGAMWLTLRPYEPGPSKADGEYRAEWMVDAREGCTVIVDPVADGRQRLLSAIEQLRDSSVALIDETALTSALMSPAPCEPDLTIVLGPSIRLPPSLVWELAYSEIVFIDTAWEDLAAAHVERATDEFSRRHRRFGGIE